jgi:serine/threonine protein kinase
MMIRTLKNSYHSFSVIGEGAFAKVYAAYSLVTSQKVAIKV